MDFWKEQAEELRRECQILDDAREPSSSLNNSGEEQENNGNDDNSGYESFGDDSVVELLFNQDAYTLNKRLISTLEELKTELLINIEECDRRLDQIFERMKKRESHMTYYRKMVNTVIAMPYFKDKQGFSAPANKDALLKKQRKELCITQLPKMLMWSGSDRDSLLKAIHAEVLHNIISPQVQNSIAKVEKVENNKVLPKDYKDLIGPLGCHEFDWLKISASDFSNKHTPEECRAMWNLYLHPDINKKRWPKTEDLTLLTIANKHKKQDWDTIAKELNTNRSSYQCFIRYNTITNITKDSLKDSPWTPKEDSLLLNIMNNLTLGDFVPWGEVANYMGTRSKNQVYIRMVYCLSPTIKKGRFTREEDNILIEGVKKFGPNFPKISSLLFPNRTTSQLNDHYQMLDDKMKNGNENKWLAGDDVKLVGLYKQYGADWSIIAQSFPSKNRTQVRHRYNALERAKRKRSRMHDYVAKLFPDDVKRARLQPGNTQVCTSKDCETDGCTYEDIGLYDDIDKKLINHFQALQSLERPNRAIKNVPNDGVKMYDILRKLGVSLLVPEIFTEEQDRMLSNQDKQLICYLKEYVTLRSNESIKENISVESRRNMMFGPIDESELHSFIAVPTFDIDKRNLKKCRVRSDGIIDCVLNENRASDDALNEPLTTPEEMKKYIKSHEERTFEKLKTMISQKCRDRAIERTCNVDKVSEGDSTLRRRHSQFSSNNLMSADGEGPLTLEDEINEMLNRAPSEQMIPLGPSRAGLVAYLNLFNRLQPTIESQQPIRNNPEMSQGIQLLINRYKTIFSFPIAMSRTPLPEVYPTDIFLSNDDGEASNPSN